MTTIIDPVTEPAAGSPEALLRAAVSGGGSTAGASSPDKGKAAAGAVAAKTRRLDPLTLGIAGTALALGTLLGAGTTILAAPKADAGVALADLNAGLEANRADASRLTGEVERLARALAALRESTDLARTEAKTRGSGLTERFDKMEHALTAKVATLGERVEQADREQGARLTAFAAQAEKKSATAAAAPAMKDPVQTGSIPEVKAKPTVIETWAVREVYDGTAMLEDRRRRLVEVSPGGSVPGLGRAESIERRGREWVVVTRQGLITPQSW